MKPKHSPSIVWIATLTLACALSCQAADRWWDGGTSDKLDWPQTYSGEWPAPAVKYGVSSGVSSIPRIIIIGRDGNILTTEGRGREETFILQALGANANS